MIEPRNDMVLIERIEEKPSSKIIIPDIAKERGIKGKVLAVGPGKWIEGINGGQVRKRLEVKPGDLVLFNSKWDDLSGTHYHDDKIVGDKLHLVMEADIFCRING